MERSDEDLARLLLEHGAEVNTSTAKGETPLLAALKSYSANASEALAELLMAKGACVDVVLPDGSTLLHIAAQSGYSRIAEQLIAKGVDINAKMAYSERPLHKAIQYCHADMVKLLIAHGADVNAVTEDWRGPMDYANAVYSRDPNIEQMVRAAGGKEGKVLKREREGRTH